jgi:phage shock protein C
VSATTPPPEAPSGPPAPPPDDVPRLLRSRSDRVIGGVCGGIGRHLRIDPVIVRLVFVVLLFAGGSGLLAYIVAWVVIPEEPLDGSIVAVPRPATSSSLVAGLALVGLGTVLLVERLFPAFSWRYVGPAALIVLGIVLIVRRGAPR